MNRRKGRVNDTGDDAFASFLAKNMRNVMSSKAFQSEVNAHGWNVTKEKATNFFMEQLVQAQEEAERVATLTREREEVQERLVEAQQRCGRVEAELVAAKQEVATLEKELATYDERLGAVATLHEEDSEPEPAPKKRRGRRRSPRGKRVRAPAEEEEEEEDNVAVEAEEDEESEPAVAADSEEPVAASAEEGHNEVEAAADDDEDEDGPQPMELEEDEKSESDGENEYEASPQPKRATRSSPRAKRNNQQEKQVALFSEVVSRAMARGKNREPSTLFLCAGNGGTCRNRIQIFPKRSITCPVDLNFHMFEELFRVVANNSDGIPDAWRPFLFCGNHKRGECQGTVLLARYEAFCQATGTSVDEAVAQDLRSLELTVAPKTRKRAKEKEEADADTGDDDDAEPSEPEDAQPESSADEEEDQPNEDPSHDSWVLEDNAILEEGLEMCDNETNFGVPTKLGMCLNPQRYPQARHIEYLAGSMMTHKNFMFLIKEKDVINPQYGGLKECQLVVHCDNEKVFVACELKGKEDPGPLKLMAGFYHQSYMTSDDKCRQIEHHNTIWKTLDESLFTEHGGVNPEKAKDVVRTLREDAYAIMDKFHWQHKQDQAV